MMTNWKKLRQMVLAASLLLGFQAHGQSGNVPAPSSNPEVHTETITIPAGTRMLIALTSPLHTTSATAGSGIYSEAAAAVVQDGHVVIPLRTQVQGIVQSEQRPGRVKGRARLLLHFTTLIFPNNYVVPIDGAMQGIPESRKLRTQNQHGTLEPVDQIDKDVKTIVTPALIGGTVGSVRSLGPGTFTGAGAGALAGLAVAMFTRGDEIGLPAGTNVEIVLQRPVTLQAERIR